MKKSCAICDNHLIIKKYTSTLDNKSISSCEGYWNDIIETNVCVDWKFFMFQVNVNNFHKLVHTWKSKMCNIWHFNYRPRNLSSDVIIVFDIKYLLLISGIKCSYRRYCMLWWMITIKNFQNYLYVTSLISYLDFVHALFSITYHVSLIKYRNQNWELIQNCNFDKIKFEDVHCVMWRKFSETISRSKIVWKTTSYYSIEYTYNCI